MKTLQHTDDDLKGKIKDETTRQDHHALEIKDDYKKENDNFVASI